MLLSELLAICRREMAAVPDAAPGEAEILVSAVTGIPRGRLFLSMKEEIGDASARLFPLVARRRAGEPLQYVLGAWDFCGREFRLSRDTLIPRPETEGVGGAGPGRGRSRSPGPRRFPRPLSWPPTFRTARCE